MHHYNGNCRENAEIGNLSLPKAKKSDKVRLHNILYRIDYNFPIYTCVLTQSKRGNIGEQKNIINYHTNV